MIYLSSLLSDQFPVTKRIIIDALALHGIPVQYIPNTKDIWLRDFMPVQTRTGQLVSFRYEPSYLAKFPKLRTDFRRDIAQSFGCSVVYSDINLDGGNVVFSPSKETVETFREKESPQSGTAAPGTRETAGTGDRENPLRSRVTR